MNRPTGGLICVLLSVSAGCGESRPSVSPGAQAPVRTAQAARHALPAQEYELATGTVYYGGDPLRGHKPDGTLRRGTRVSLVRRAGNYSVVRTEDGSEAYVATHLLEPLAMQQPRKRTPERKVKPMDHKAISQQLLIEYELLTHLESALRNILQWTSRGQDLSRKLSSLRFMEQAFERHFERLMTLEEHDGYMEVVVESRPTLSPRVDALREEHEVFRRALRRVAARIERLSADDPAGVAAVCEELGALLVRVDEHSAKEVDLLQESLNQEEGAQD